MRGERLAACAFEGSGMVGDRRIALESTAAPRGKPLLSGRERAAMLRYTPSLAAALSMRTPEGATLPLDSPELLPAIADDLSRFGEGAASLPPGSLGWRRSEEPLTDVRPVSLIGTSSLEAVRAAWGKPLDPQRFRSNLILALDAPDYDRPFAEDDLAGQVLHLGGARLLIKERIPRCRFVALDPDTAIGDGSLLPLLARERGNRLGVYATVQEPGRVREGDYVSVEV